MMWALRHAVRELRGSGRHFAYLAACVTLGVAALVAVGSLGRSVERTVATSGRALMGGDVEIRSSQPLSAAAESAVGALGREGARDVRLRELAAMAQAGPDRVLLVELKAVGEGYPLYGRLETVPPAPLTALIGGGRVLVQEAVLSRLGLSVGDALRIGEAEFRVAGLITSEPDRAVGFFSLGPRVLMADADLAATGLVRLGSRVRHRALIALPDGRPPGRLAMPSPRSSRRAAFASPPIGRRSPGSGGSGISSQPIWGSPASSPSSWVASGSR